MEENMVGLVIKSWVFVKKYKEIEEETPMMSDMTLSKTPLVGLVTAKVTTGPNLRH